MRIILAHKDILQNNKTKKAPKNISEINDKKAGKLEY